MTTEEFLSCKAYSCEISALLQTETDQNTELFQLCYETASRLMKQKEKNLELAARIKADNPRAVVVEYLSDSRKTFDSISAEMCYSLRSVTRFFKSGIEELLSSGYLTA